MPSKPKNTAKQNTMSPAEIAAANKSGISFLAEKFPMHTIGDAQSASNDDASVGLAYLPLGKPRQKRILK
jgi:hypothetical protein